MASDKLKDLVAGTTALEKMKKLVQPSESPKHEIGDPEKESRCQNIHVFMEASGFLGKTRKRKKLPPTATLREAKDAYGPMWQNVMQDLHRYQILNSDMDSKISDFSHRCALDLKFAYSSYAYGLVRMSSAAMDTAWNVAKYPFTSSTPQHMPEPAQLSKQEIT